MNRIVKKLKNKIRNNIQALLINIIASSQLTPYRARYYIYKKFGINTNTYSINPGCFFRTSNNVEIGFNTFINNGCFIENNEYIKIGDNCSIAMDVLIGTDTHEIGGANMRAGKVLSLPITIGNGCWIGTRATILAGVTIGDGCIIAAGAVVTKDCEANGLYAGVPARRIRNMGV